MNDAYCNTWWGENATGRKIMLFHAVRMWELLFSSFLRWNINNVRRRNAWKTIWFTRALSWIHEAKNRIAESLSYGPPGITTLVKTSFHLVETAFLNCIIALLLGFLSTGCIFYWKRFTIKLNGVEWIQKPTGQRLSSATMLYFLFTSRFFRISHSCGFCHRSGGETSSFRFRDELTIP